MSINTEENRYENDEREFEKVLKKLSSLKN